MQTNRVARNVSEWRTLGLALVFGGLLGGCSGDGADPPAGPNPFLEDQGADGKSDTGYLNPDGVEVEVDLEANVTSPGNRITHAPADVGQFAMTYLRKAERMYLESWAETATSEQTVEWLVDGTWLTAAQARSVETSKLKRFRLRTLNAVLLKKYATDVTEGMVVTAKVPVKPYTIFNDAGKSCADVDPHYPVDQTYYWDAWNPDQDGCPEELVQEASITVRRVLTSPHDTYPEYDRLVADGKVTTVMIFGQMGDGETVSNRDQNMTAFRNMAEWLKGAGFREVTPAPVGRRFTKTVRSVVFEIDLYSPMDFRGLEDLEHFDTFDKALREHEIVIYDGHSVLGASDFWSRPHYPDFYQIYIYGGCLGYEYYIRPILDGKGGWDNVDIMSSVVEVTASAAEFGAPVVAKIMWAVEHDYGATWRDLLIAVRRKVGNSTFGVSGVKDNCFSPRGSLCTDSGVAQDFARDIISTDLSIDLAALEGTATITLAPSGSTAASFSVGDLDIREVTSAGGALRYTASAGQLNVRVPATTAPLAVEVRYGLTRHSTLKGLSPKGLTMLWPYYCGYLFPCKPNPDDGLTFTLNLTGLPSGAIAVYPTTIPADAPSYMLAFAVGDYERLDLGRTTAGTSVSVWYYRGERRAAETGTRTLAQAFDWFEKTYGEYAFGPAVGSVAADWGDGAFGGMEHHPYWHIGRTAMNDAETHIHEAGHGWYGNGVRIRCWEDFVLSEGTTSYITARAIEATQGVAAGNALWSSYREQLDAAVAGGNTAAWPEGCNAIDILRHPLWSDIPYMKGAFFLRAVERQVGPVALDRALQTFYLVGRGAALGVQDLLDTIQAETGFDPNPLAEAWLRRAEVPPA
jgi:hypothetical protein